MYALLRGPAGSNSTTRIASVYPMQSMEEDVKPYRGEQNPSSISSAAYPITVTQFNSTHNRLYNVHLLTHMPMAERAASFM